MDKTNSNDNWTNFCINLKYITYSYTHKRSRNYSGIPNWWRKQQGRRGLCDSTIYIYRHHRPTDNDFQMPSPKLKRNNFARNYRIHHLRKPAINQVWYSNCSSIYLFFVLRENELRKKIHISFYLWDLCEENVLLFYIFFLFKFISLFYVFLCQCSFSPERFYYSFSPLKLSIL